jgi:hypothetical protein
MCNAVRDAIIDRLGEHKQLPAGFKHPADFSCPINFTRLVDSVVGREQAQQDMLGALRKRKAVILWGGPGEGKSTLAVDTAYKMWEDGEVKGGALRVDLTGTHQLPAYPIWETSCLSTSQVPTSFLPIPFGSCLACQPHTPPPACCVRLRQEQQPCIVNHQSAPLCAMQVSSSVWLSRRPLPPCLRKTGNTHRWVLTRAYSGPDKSPCPNPYTRVRAAGRTHPRW